MEEQAQSWEEQLCYSTPTGTPHKVLGKDQNFYPVSVDLAFTLRRIAKQAAKALGHVFSNKRNDTRTTDQTLTQKDGTVNRTTVCESLSVEMAEYRDNQQAMSWADTVDTIADPESMKIIAVLIIDSLRDVFPEGKRPNAEVFLKKTPLTAITAMVVGVCKANKDVFGPLAERVGLHLSNLENVIDSKMDELTAARKSESAPQS